MKSSLFFILPTHPPTFILPTRNWYERKSSLSVVHFTRFENVFSLIFLWGDCCALSRLVVAEMVRNILL